MASKKSKQEEALKFLDDLDSFAPPPTDSAAGAPTNAKSSPPAGSANEGEAAEVLAFLDEITQKSTEPIRTTTGQTPRSGTPTMTEKHGAGAPRRVYAIFFGILVDYIPESDRKYVAGKG